MFPQHDTYFRALPRDPNNWTHNGRFQNESGANFLGLSLIGVPADLFPIINGKQKQKKWHVPNWRDLAKSVGKSAPIGKRSAYSNLIIGNAKPWNYIETADTISRQTCENIHWIYAFLLWEPASDKWKKCAKQFSTSPVKNGVSDRNENE